MVADVYVMNNEKPTNERSPAERRRFITHEAPSPQPKLPRKPSPEEGGRQCADAFSDLYKRFKSRANDSNDTV